jgi:hypothetical protein
MFVSTFLLAAMHATIRHLSEAIHPFEIAFFRSLFALAVVVPWFYRFAWLGGAIIFVSAMYIVYHERRVAGARG